MGTPITVEERRYYRNTFHSLEHTSIRVRRLFAIACYEYVESYLRKPLDHIIKFASDMCISVDEGSLALNSFQEMRKLMIEESQQDFILSLGTNPWQSDIAYNLVKLCVSTDVPWRELASIVWGMGCFKELDKFKQLIVFDDFDIGDRCHRWSSQKFSETTVGIAKACYEGDWDQRFVLADALEELENVPTNWHQHLRANDRHWRGCWVVDNLLGKS